MFICDLGTLRFYSSLYLYTRYCLFSNTFTSISALSPCSTEDTAIDDDDNTFFSNADGQPSPWWALDLHGVDRVHTVEILPKSFGLGRFNDIGVGTCGYAVMCRSFCDIRSQKFIFSLPYALFLSLFFLLLSLSSLSTNLKPSSKPGLRWYTTPT